MTQYNSLDVKLFNSKLTKLKSRTKNSTEVTLNLSSNVILCDPLLFVSTIWTNKIMWRRNCKKILKIF